MNQSKSGFESFNGMAACTLIIYQHIDVIRIGTSNFRLKNITTNRISVDGKWFEWRWPKDDNVTKRIEHDIDFDINGLLGIMG